MNVKFMVNYGGFVGAEEEYEVEVNDNATDEEIEDAVQEEYMELVLNNCSWEIISKWEEE